MLEMKQCCQVPFPEKLFEGYEIKENAIYANVNTSKVLGLMMRFVLEHAKDPLFFVLEIPTKAPEGEVGKEIHHDLGDDVYFIDGLNAEQAAQCLEALGSFLIKDGLNTFGFGDHENGEEILFGRYNLLTMYGSNPEAFRAMFSDFDIPHTEALLTAWDTFDREHPGTCKMYVSEKTGKTIYDIPADYKEYGMYFYEQRGGAAKED